MSGEGNDAQSAEIISAGGAMGLEPVTPIPSYRSSRRGNCRQADVALIDEFPLRRASTLILLRVHLRLNARLFSGTAELLAQVPKKVDRPSGVIMCVGGRSVREPPQAEQLRRLRGCLDPAPVIILSDRDESEEVVAAFREGARGYIPTSLEPRLVIKAIRMVLAGGTFVPAGALMRSRFRLQPETERVTCPDPEQMPVEHGETWPPRQLAVLNLLIEGKANKEIARALTMEESTVKVHVRHIMRRLGVTNRTQAAVSARRLGIPVVGEGAPASAVSRPSLTPVPTQPQCFSGVLTS